MDERQHDQRGTRIADGRAAARQRHQTAMAPGHSEWPTVAPIHHQRGAPRSHQSGLVGRVGFQRCAARLASVTGSPRSRVPQRYSDAHALCERVGRVKQPGDIAVVSVHWGSNWGYDVPRAQVRFAHRLIDSGVDVVHGHSSHHPRAVEVYRDRLVLYGCGDLINDYEGIAGQELFRGDLRLLYLARLDPAGRLDELRMVPLQSRQMRLRLATGVDARWLHRVLRKASSGFRIAGRPRARRQPAAVPVRNHGTTRGAAMVIQPLGGQRDHRHRRYPPRVVPRYRRSMRAVCGAAR